LLEGKLPFMIYEYKFIPRPPMKVQVFRKSSTPAKDLIVKQLKMQGHLGLIELKYAPVGGQMKYFFFSL
jgi:hypothetical protein